MREPQKSLWGSPMSVWLGARLSMHKARLAKAYQTEAGKGLRVKQKTGR